MKEYKNISWGIDSLDKTIGKMCIGNVYVLAGKTCMGKTPFLLNLLHYVSVKEKRRILFLTTNHDEVQRESLGEILVMLNGEMAKYDLFGMSHEMWERGYEASKKLQNAPFEIYSLKGCDNVDGVKEACLRYGNLELLMVDNVNDLAKEIAHNTGGKKDIAAIMKMLKHIAIKYHFAVIAVCRAKEKSGKRNNTPPRVEEIKKYKEIAPEMDFFISMCRTGCSVDQSEGKEVVEFLICRDYKKELNYQSLQLLYIWDKEKFCDM